MFRKKKYGFLGLPVLLFFSLVLRNSGVEGAQLDLLIDQAMKQNPEILAASKRIEALKQEIPQEKALEDPQFTVTQWQIPSNFDLTNPAQTWYGIGQAFPFPGKRSLKGKIAEKEVDAQFQMLQATIREVLLKVKTAYYQLFMADQGIKIHRDHQVLLEEFTRSAQQKYSAGMGSQQDIVKAEVELSKLHASLLALEEEKIHSETTLNTLLNQPAEMAQEPALEEKNIDFSTPLDELISAVLKTHPELMAADLQIEKKETALSLAQKYVYPDFMAELTYMESYRGEPNMWMAVAKINLPWVFNQKYQAKINQIRLEKEGVEAERVQIRNQTLGELRILYSKIKSLHSTLNMYQNGILPQAEQALKSSRIAYRTGKTDLLNVIDSERTLKDLQLNYYEIFVQYKEQISELEKITGKELN